MHLVTGLLERDGALLLVASRYPNQADLLWNLPGGRQRDGELLCDALQREFVEETGLTVAVGALAYVAESYDREAKQHFINFAFHVAADGEPAVPSGDAHARACAWVARGDLERHLVVAVVREPLLAHVDGRHARYSGFADAGITIEFADPA